MLNLELIIINLEVHSNFKLFLGNEMSEFFFGNFCLCDNK
jgi:hypothetical protein